MSQHYNMNNSFLPPNFQVQNVHNIGTVGSFCTPANFNEPKHYASRSLGSEHSPQNIPHEGPPFSCNYNFPPFQGSCSSYSQIPNGNLYQNLPPSLFNENAPPPSFQTNDQRWPPNQPFLNPPPRFPNLGIHSSLNSRNSGFFSASEEEGIERSPLISNPETEATAGDFAQQSAGQFMKGKESISQRTQLFFSKEEDEWIKNWAYNVEKRNQEKKIERKAKQIKLNDIQRKLLQYATKTKELEEIVIQLSEVEEDSDCDGWQTLKNTSEILKREIQEFRTFFENEDNLNKIQVALLIRRGKRKKARIAKGKGTEKWKRIKEAWKKKQIEIDNHLKQLYEEEKEKINEENMKRVADTILREVRTKQEEAKQMLQLLKILSTLRDARTKKGEIHGFVSSPEASAFFSMFREEFEKLLPEQLNHYKSEEQTLRVMMEESGSVPRRQTPATANIERLQSQAYKLLFGDQTFCQVPKEYQQSFTSADESVEILVKRRTDWDKYIVTEGGTALPIGWVIPNETPNRDWKRFQTN